MSINSVISMTKKMPRSFSALLGAAPLLMAAAPMAFTPESENWQAFVRIYSFIVFPIELLAVFILMHNGSSIARGWKELPKLSKWAILAHTLISFYISFQPAVDHFAAVLGLLRVAFAGLLVLALLGGAGFGKQDWKSLWCALALGAVLYFALFTFYVMSNDLSGEQWLSPFPGFNNIRHVAFLGLMAFGGGLGYLLLSENTADNKMWLKVSILFGVPALVFVLWTGSRGPFLAIILVTIGCFCLFGGNRHAIALYSFSSFVLGVAIASTLPLPNPIFGVLQALGLSDVSSQNLNAASSGRLEIWQYTFGEILKRPFFGWGVNQFEHFLSDNNMQLLHPHNYPLQLLFASGFVGATFLAIAVTAFVENRIRDIRGEAERFNAIFTLSLLIYALYDGILYFSYPIMIFALVFVGSIHPQPALDKSN